jgi:steroid 5-alpha reductase family enzyme
MHAPLEWPFIAQCALADLAATVVVFAFSVAANNTSVYDPYWSVMPPVLAGCLLLRTGVTARGAAIVALVTIWGIRLTYNWARGWRGLPHEDWRYVAFRKHGGAYWLISFFGLQLFPSVMTFLGCLPLFFAFDAGLNVIQFLGAAIMLGATALEAIADEQLRSFRSNTANDGRIIDTGLWSWSRHPNYLGELGFWLGVCVLGVGSGAPWWTAVGIVALIGLFRFASIPLAEARSLQRRPGFAEHQRKVSMLLPWPPKGR